MRLRSLTFAVVVAAAQLAAAWLGLELAGLSGGNVLWVAAGLGIAAPTLYLVSLVPGFAPARAGGPLPSALFAAAAGASPEEELHRIRELSRLVVEHTDELISLLDLEGTVVYLSPSSRRVLGFDPEEITGRPAFDLVHPDDVEGAAATVAGAAAGEPASTRVRIRTVDEGWIVVEGSASLIRDEEGEPWLILATGRDVTDRVQAGEALRQAEERYRSLVEHLPLVTYVDSFEERSENLYTSPQIEPLLGYPAEQWTSDPDLFVRTLHPEDRDRVLAEHAEAHATGQPLRTEYRLLARDGTVVWLHDEAVVVRDETGRPLFLQGYLMDITDSRQADRALRESESRFRTIFDSSPAGVAVTDEAGRLVTVNSTLADMLGYAVEELTTLTFADLTLPEDVDEDLALYARLMRGEIDCYRVEKRYLRKDGQELWGSLTVSRLAEGDGRPRLAIGMVEDVTRRKRLEEQLQQSQKMEAVGRLAGGVAHDFNNLLTGIIGYAGLLRAALPADGELRADADEVLKAADRAASLTRQLLAFSRRQVLQPRVLDLNDVVGDMDRMLRRLIGEDVELVTERDPDLGAVEADPGQIEQVIANLVVNARDAMSDGGRLVVRTANLEVNGDSPATAPEMAHGAYVLLSVTDTGQGMDPATQARIFEPFFTTKEVGKGTGLGLATVYGIVKQSGGYIWVASESGCGTTFDVLLPRVEAPVAAGSTRRSAGAPEGAGGAETVLVVEDEGLVRELIARDLSDRGYTVIAARSGAEALAAARSATAVDLLVTDVVMPGMGGPELARRLAAERGALQVVYMSGYAERAVVEELAPWPFLQKPFTVGELADTIRQVLDVPVRAA